MTKEEVSYRTKKLFVGGLPQTVTDEQFREYFDQFGRIEDSVIMVDKVTGKSRGFGFITFESEESVELAVSRYYDNKIDGKWIECKKALPRDSNASTTTVSPSLSAYSSKKNSVNQNAADNDLEIVRGILSNNQGPSSGYSSKKNSVNKNTAENDLEIVRGIVGNNQGPSSGYSSKKNSMNKNAAENDLEIVRGILATNQSFQKLSISDNGNNEFTPSPFGDVSQQPGLQPNWNNVGQPTNLNKMWNEIPSDVNRMNQQIPVQWEQPQYQYQQGMQQPMQGYPTQNVYSTPVFQPTYPQQQSPHFGYTPEPKKMYQPTQSNFAEPNKISDQDDELFNEIFSLVGGGENPSQEEETNYRRGAINISSNVFHPSQFIFGDKPPTGLNMNSATFQNFKEPTDLGMGFFSQPMQQSTNSTK
mgnify:FL=1